MSAIALLTACSSSDATGQGASGDEAAGDKTLEISLLASYPGLPFYTAMQCGAQDAARDQKAEVKLTLDGPTTGLNVATQTPVLEAVITRRPDGMIFVTTDPVAMVAPVKRAIGEGIKVVTADSTLSQPIALAQFRGDNKSGGKLAADQLVKAVDGKAGKVLVLDGSPGQPVTNDRADGFIDAAKATSGLSLLPTAYYGTAESKASTLVSSTVLANPDLVGIFATSEPAAIGAIAGLKSLPADKRPVLIAYDADEVLVKALKDGAISALVAQGSYTQGYDAMVRLIQEIRGQQPADAAFDNVVDNALVTKENVDQPDIQKMLYPASCPTS